MPHYVDGFELKFTSRVSWKAELRFLHQRLGIVPVALTKGRRQGALPREVFQEVWYRNAEELRRQVVDLNPFILALAEAKDDHELPAVFDGFVGIISSRFYG